MTAKAKPDHDALHVGVESFFCRIDGQEFFVKQGSRWKGDVVRLHPQFFVPVDEADEPALHAARAALWSRVES